MFIPAKETVSLQDRIFHLYGVDKIFEFDKTYVDLVHVMSKTIPGGNYREFVDTRDKLKGAIGGRLEFDNGKKLGYSMIKIRG